MHTLMYYASKTDLQSESYGMKNRAPECKILRDLEENIPSETRRGHSWTERSGCGEAIWFRGVVDLVPLPRSGGSGDGDQRRRRRGGRRDPAGGGLDPARPRKSPRRRNAGALLRPAIALDTSLVDLVTRTANVYAI